VDDDMGVRMSSPTLAIPRARVLSEYRSTRESTTWPKPPSGDGRPAMLIPGFLAGDPSLSRMARWLRSGGYKMARSGVTWNVACMEPTLRGVERRLEAAVQATGRRALVVGQSRGGVIGRALAVRRPDLVETLVTLGSPVRDQLAVHPHQWVPIGMVVGLGTLGVPGMFRLSCIRGECCARARAELTMPFPEGVGYLGFYSRSDEVVKWEACLDPEAKQVEVSCSHVGMGMDAGVWRRLSGELARLDG
jgi:triacylglycerol lipase